MFLEKKKNTFDKFKVWSLIIFKKNNNKVLVFNYYIGFICLPETIKNRLLNKAADVKSSTLEVWVPTVSFFSYLILISLMFLSATYGFKWLHGCLKNFKIIIIIIITIKENYLVFWFLPKVVGFSISLDSLILLREIEVNIFFKQVF